MTRTTNARLAGIIFLLYIVTGVVSMVLSGQVTGGADSTATKLASFAQHAAIVRVNIVLTLLQAVYAIVLGVTLYALTREQDADLSLMALCFRVAEGIVSAMAPVRSLALLSIATASTATSAAASPQPFASLLFSLGGTITLIGATCFAVGSTIFSYLFLRARSIPVVLSCLGIIASALLVIALPLQLTHVLAGAITGIIWVPMLVFEVALSVWLLTKGVAPKARAQSA